MALKRIYEITNKDYIKYYIRGLKSDYEATKLGKYVFGKYFFDISYYDNYPSKRTNWKHKSLTISQFKKFRWRYRK